MAKYPVWKKGDKVRIVNSTASPSSLTREFAERQRQGIVTERNPRREKGDKPTYTVKVRHASTPDWYDVSYREWNYYTFSATDLAKWGA